ncbi:MAG: hypothetical protein FJ026_00215 [Chloroflexi bacterium]|nr:hypothetical protein [Chloroflexota bacterium]
MKHANNISEGALPAIPQYDSTLFVNREKEIELVTKKAQALVLGEIVRERTVIFWGYRGTGKTWLLRYIASILESMPGVKPVYVDLAAYQCQPTDKAMKALLAQTASDIWGSESAQASLYRRAVDVPLPISTAWLARDIQTLLQQQVLVLLLDHVYELPWDLLERLEDQILAPVVVQPRALLVMAGGGQAYPWKTPELRLYAEHRHLVPFDQNLTKQQLERQHPSAVPRATEIHELSQGYPLGNYLLAARPTLAEAMQETVGGLLDKVPAEERSWLEALCVLRSFDEERIPVLLAVYLNDSSILKWPYKEVRQKRDRLLQTRLVRWKEEAGGWEVDEAIRPLLEKYLQQTKPEAWQQLHCAAYRLYKGWEQQYPDEKQRWQDEARHHAGCLRNAGHDPDQCP